MQVLTPSGYVDILDLNIGDEVVAYDINTGAVIINTLENKQLWTPDMYPAQYTEGYYDENGDWIPPALYRTSYEVFQSMHGDWKYYKINGTWNLFKDQSVWANFRVVHATDLQIGDIVYNDTDGDVIITSIEEVDVPLEWWKLDVSGDSSYIADGITLHNASRYWVGGGSSSNWNATGNTNWGSVSGTQDNASVPTSADAVTFDGAGVAGNTNSTISANITILSLNITAAYTATMTHNALLQVGGNVTLGANYTIAGTSTLQLNTTSTFTSNEKTWPNDFTLSYAPATLTLVGNLTINGTLYVGAYNGAPAAVVNKTTTEKLIVNGGLAGGIGTGPNYINGTASLDFYGSTWAAVQTGIPITVYGNVTFVGGNLGSYGGFTNSGTINAGTSTFYANGPNFNSNGAVFNNFKTGYGTLTLTSDLTINGIFTNDGSQNINKTTNEVVYAYGGLTQATSNQTFAGTATIVLKGSTWTAGLTSSAPFTMPITIDGNVTIGGALIYGGTFTYSSGTLTQSSGSFTLGNYAQTLNLNGLSINFPIILGGNTKTLSSNFSTSGLITVSAGTIINKTASETFSCGGGIAVNSTLAGTATITLTGGTWSGTNTTGISAPLNINGNVTISGNVYYGTGTLGYLSGTITGGTLNLVANCTINTSTLGWNNLTISSGTIYTLTSNLRINGLLYAAVGGGTKINKTTNEVVYCYGGFNIGNNFTGTAEIIAKGGTLISNGFAAINGPNLTVDGDVTFSGTFTYGAGTFTYLSGNVSMQSQTFSIGSCTFNTKGLDFINVTLSDTLTLTSDMVVNGLFTNNNGSFINKTNNEILYLKGGLNVANFWMRGTGTISLQGGTWTQTAVRNVECNLIIDGNVILGSNCAFTTGTLTYKSGTISGLPLNIVGSCNMIDFNKCSIIPNVIVTTGSTITMNQFFTGIPSTPTSISASTAAGTYTIVFQDNFEKIATNVVTQGCVLSRPMQLILSSPLRINTIKTTNSGIRYVNQSPNGFAKNAPTVTGMFVGVPGGLQSDSCFTKQS